MEPSSDGSHFGCRAVAPDSSLNLPVQPAPFAINFMLATDVLGFQACYALQRNEDEHLAIPHMDKYLHFIENF